VRDLLEHTSRTLSTMETHLDVTGAESGPVDLADAVAYYRPVLGSVSPAAM
jgi:hypothetical protein